MNLEAVKELACQLRLRDVGGIVIVDLIDMEKDKNRQAVLAALKDAVAIACPSRSKALRGSVCWR